MYYMLLTTPRKLIIQREKHRELFGEPSLLRTDPQRHNRSRYCHYHRDHGHDTSDCYELKDKIEELIQKGELRQYVHEAEAGTSTKER